MIYIGTDPGGRRVKLPVPQRVRLNRCAEAPADSFSGVFPFQPGTGNLTGIQIYGEDGELCFEGIVDEQTSAFGSSAAMKLEARSRAALLLDNEAVPASIYNSSLPLIFARCAQPYGFTQYVGDSRSFAGELNIVKGMSEWQAAELFCKKFLLVTPRMENGVFNATGKGTGGTLCFGGKNGIRYSSLSLTNAYCRMLSELAVAGDGAALFRCEEARVLGVRRRRFLTAGQNADALFRAAEKNAMEVKIECPGEIPGLPGMKAAVEAPGLGGLAGLSVSKVDYILEPEGEVTRFSLRRM